MPEYVVICGTNLKVRVAEQEQCWFFLDLFKIRGYEASRELDLVAIIAASCQKSEVVSLFTGNETTYALQQSSQFAVSGTVTFRERKDGKISAAIMLTGKSPN